MSRTWRIWPFNIPPLHILPFEFLISHKAISVPILKTSVPHYSQDIDFTYKNFFEFDIVGYWLFEYMKLSLWRALRSFEEWSPQRGIVLHSRKATEESGMLSIHSARVFYKKSLCSGRETTTYTMVKPPWKRVLRSMKNQLMRRFQKSENRLRLAT